MNLSTFNEMKRVLPSGGIRLHGSSLRELQLALCAMLDDIMLVCRESGFDWTLGGGSVLGALRHKGFIPWDDDLDLNMPRSQWAGFRNAFLARFGDKYVVYEPGRPEDYPLAFPRIRLKGTSVITREDLLFPDLEHGVFIDVFLLENTFDNVFLRYLHGAGAMLLGLLYSCRKQFFERKQLRNWGVNGAVFRLKRAIGFFLAVFPLKTWVRIWHGWNGLCGNDESRYVTFPVGRRHFFGELAERDGLHTSRTAEFEGRTVLIPAKSEQYMVRLYGASFMVPPPLKDREKHVFFPPFSLQRGHGAANVGELSESISVVIPVYGRDYALATVPFLLRQRYAKALRIVVIDNGNGGELSARLHALEGDCVHVISLDENLGGSAAYITGVDFAMKEHADTGAIWLLDDDAVPDAETLPRLCAALDEMRSSLCRVACIGSTVLDADDSSRVLESGARYSVFLGHAFARNAGRSAARLKREILAVDYCAACSVLIPKSVISRCGFWEDVFIHFDDIEWGLRVKRRFGCQSYAVTDSFVRHQRFSPDKAGDWICYFDARNQYWLAAKYGRLSVASAWLKNVSKNAMDLIGRQYPGRILLRRLAWRDYCAGVRRNRKEVENVLAEHAS